MKLGKTVESEVQQRLQDVQQVAQNHFGVPIEMPAVKYRLRGTSAGRYCLLSRVIDFNRPLLLNNKESFVHHTVPHEFAHHVVNVIRGAVGFRHGKEWQAVMRLFQIPPRITHDYDVSAINPRYVWTCGCKPHFFSKRAHKEILSGSEYDCMACEAPVNTFVR